MGTGIAQVARETGHWVTYPPFFHQEQGEHLLATGDVLFVVLGEPPSGSGTVPADVGLVIEALP